MSDTKNYNINSEDGLKEYIISELSNPIHYSYFFFLCRKGCLSTKAMVKMATNDVFDVFCFL